MRKRVYKSVRRGDGLHPLAHTGGSNRRKDKLNTDKWGIPRWLARYWERYSGAKILFSEGKEEPSE